MTITKQQKSCDCLCAHVDRTSLTPFKADPERKLSPTDLMVSMFINALSAEYMYK